MPPLPPLVHLTHGGSVIPTRVGGVLPGLCTTHFVCYGLYACVLHGLVCGVLVCGDLLVMRCYVACRVVLRCIVGWFSVVHAVHTARGGRGVGSFPPHSLLDALLRKQ